jgi:hypothetical protein
MNNKINTPCIVVDSKKYKSEEELWKAIASVCKVLLENENQLLLTYEGIGIYCISYDHDPLHGEWGVNRFMYVTADESEIILDRREENSEEN